MLNLVQLIGNLGADPEIRNLRDGGKVCNLRIATTETWRDKQSGDRKERTEWHTVVIFNEKIADVAERFLRKGSRVYVSGQLQTRKWQDQNGADRYSTEVVLRGFGGELKLLDRRERDDQGDERSSSQSSRSPEPDDFDDSQIPF